MSRNIIAIHANTNPTRYVSGVSRRPGNQLLAELTDDKNKAQDFGSISYAESVITRLVNPFNRVFKPLSLKVTQPARQEDGYNEELL